MDVPEAYGGLGADFLYSVILTEELGRTATRDWPHRSTVISWCPTFQALVPKN
jgi:alkylation response protein AidB-like acyl-CoA dehydrogenase